MGTAEPWYPVPATARDRVGVIPFMTTLESRIEVESDILFRDLGGEAVILNLRTGRYFGLDEVGTRMWVLLAQNGQLEAVYHDLLSEYEVSQKQLRQDLVHFVDELVSHGLVQVDQAQTS